MSRETATRTASSLRGSRVDTVSPLPQDKNDSRHNTMSAVHLLLLTCSTGGLQVVWSTIMSNGSPYLMSLGLSKPLTALVWVAAPLCGVIVQPYVGVLSDRSRHPWGRRKPFIIGGAVATILSMIALAWTEDMICGFANMNGMQRRGSGIRIASVIVAVFWVYVLNISIQPLQAGIRAFIVDNCPAHQQTQASAWASRMQGIGNIVGYVAGFSSLSTALPLPNVSQFQGLSLIASLALASTVLLSCLAISEKDVTASLLPAAERIGFLGIFQHVKESARRMPVRIRRVCAVQFCAWMGWFPFLFYSTTYVGELYSRSTRTELLQIAQVEQHALHNKATREGTLASLVSAVVALVVNILLPYIVKPSIEGNDIPRKSPKKSSLGFQGPHISLTTAWALSHLLFAFAMFTTFFVTSQLGGTLLVALVGLSWAVTLWAPFAIIGVELATRQRHRGSSDGEEELAFPTDDQAGATIGFHNVAISAPQIIAALACSGIFWFAQSIGSQDGIAWVLRAGGCAALGAAYLAFRLEC
ncbi:major facilitator superfamily domain-containing protein [Cryomyces antarcticus]